MFRNAFIFFFLHSCIALCPSLSPVLFYADGRFSETCYASQKRQSVVKRSVREIRWEILQKRFALIFSMHTTNSWLSQEKRQIYKKTAPPSEWEIVPSKRAVKKKNQRFSYCVLCQCLFLCWGISARRREHPAIALVCNKFTQNWFTNLISSLIAFFVASAVLIPMNLFNLAVWQKNRQYVVK